LRRLIPWQRDFIVPGINQADEAPAVAGGRRVSDHSI
jgi:hypothetical protein